MDTLHRRMAHQRLLERDADAALRALSDDERETLRRARTGAILDIPEHHQRHFAALCLATDRGAGFGLTELGRCAADRIGAHEGHDIRKSERRLSGDPLLVALGRRP